MLKAFAEYLANQSIKPEDRIVTIDEEKFVIDSEGTATRIVPRLDYLAQEALRLKTLTSLVDYIKRNFDNRDNILVQVKNPTEVLVYGGPLTSTGERELLAVATTQGSKFDFGIFNKTERLIIELQAQFEETSDRDTLLKVLGNLSEENVKNTGDDGVSQQVTAKVGVATMANVKVPNPVMLAPFRTFVEVEQPISPFIFRMDVGPVGALFEADGGAWKLEAINRVASFLNKSLSEEINSKRVMILA